MRLTQIQQILEIAKYSSISEAARNLYISQPTLSALLAEFEEEVGVQMFVRSKSGIEPTSDGQEILASLKNIMQEVDYVQNYTRSNETLTGSFSLLIDQPYDFIYNELLLRLNRQIPNASIIAHNNTYNPNICDKVMDGTYDLAISATYDIDTEFSPLQMEQIPAMVKPLKSCHLVAVLPPGHADCGKDKIPISSLLDSQLVFSRNFTNSLTLSNISQLFQKPPIIDFNHITTGKIIQNDGAVYMDSTPLALEHYRQYTSNCYAADVSNDMGNVIPFHFFHWPVYMFYRQQNKTRLQQLIIEEIKKFLQQNQLFRESPINT